MHRRRGWPGYRRFERKKPPDHLKVEGLGQGRMWFVANNGRHATPINVTAIRQLRAGEPGRAPMENSGFHGLVGPIIVPGGAMPRWEPGPVLPWILAEYPLGIRPPNRVNWLAGQNASPEWLAVQRCSFAHRLAPGGRPKFRGQGLCIHQPRSWLRLLPGGHRPHAVRHSAPRLTGSSPT
jgi:hypothetical protein